MKRVPWMLTAIAASLATQSVARAQTVSWGTSISDNPGLARLSNGSDMPATLIWNVGYFTGGFVPDQLNFASWGANFVSLDVDSFQNIGGGFYTVPGSFNVPPADPGIGQQVYMFAYNSLAQIGTPTGEALLLRENGTTFPASPNAISFDIADAPGDASDDSFDVIWGQVDRDADGAIGAFVTGGGVYASPGHVAPSPAGLPQFEVQTGTWALVPEPATYGAIGLLGIPLVSLWLRRRRS